MVTDPLLRVTTMLGRTHAEADGQASEGTTPGQPPLAAVLVGLRGLGRDGWRSILPAALLVAVACGQVVSTRNGVLVHWKGGGFGMFAATDGAAFRQTRIVAERDGRSEELELSPSLEVPELKARLFPSEYRLRQLAEAVASREQRRGQPVETVRVEVARTVFDADFLEPVEEVVGALAHRVR